MTRRTSVCVPGGTQDPIVPIEEQRKTAALAGGRIYEFDCGHEMPLRTIAGTVSIMLAHFADAVPPPSMTPCPAPPPRPYHRAQPWPDSRAVWWPQVGPRNRDFRPSGQDLNSALPRLGPGGVGGLVRRIAVAPLFQVGPQRLACGQEAVGGPRL